MTSLIFGGIYMGHKGIVNHRREKQRKKNYERWEGLRDEYDEQRKISRESRSLDIQRTGDYDPDRPILTLRDQQEANDARTSWRPQEAWEEPPRRTSVEVTSGSGLRPLATNKTGATWDEGLPQPLKVSRRNWDDYAPAVSRSSSLRKASTPNSPPRDTSSSNNTPSMSNRPSPRLDAPVPMTHPSHPHASRGVATPLETTMHHEALEPIQHATPGGLMAELIEGADPHRPTPYTHQPPQTYTGYPAQQNYYPPAPAPAAAPGPGQDDGSMQEWWNRPLN
ncbi:hypothetical protein A1O7_05992 [Cladophialophora yegresii CBS 114405]|uniref:Uncharacterized protein n=1 Tax=Cladophialophora yegresii CBS 114405 TaxID=1182544 RepID=W9W0R6_9EURO|nr:uncharacterized protein A1O7_05992 [Cladophialophora yegresii CBS 114405]EXJ58565.1 hypothetical protein A1O7_05992 [Cladophialophora yegresii CBS 114405]